MRKLLLMGMLVCTLFLNGCAFIDEYFLPAPEDTVQEVFEAGNDALRDKNYKQAATYFNRIKEEHPFSPYAIRSELALADAHFLDEEYWMASEAYRDFETLHPRHEAIPYVLYQLGMSLRKTYTSVDRSATEVKEAIEYFTRLQQEYPDTEYGLKAAEQIAECRKTLAQREIFIASFEHLLHSIFGSGQEKFVDEGTAAQEERADKHPHKKQFTHSNAPDT